MNLTDYLSLNWIAALRHVLGNVGFGTLLGALISALSAFLNSWLQYRRDRREWRREKLYELYSQAQESLTELVRLTVMCTAGSESVAAYYSSIGALRRLKLASPPEHQKVIDKAIAELQVMQSKGGAAIPYPYKDEIESLRDRIFRLAQEDKRLGGLFQAP